MTVTMQTARKTDPSVRCAACGGTIKKGEKYLESYGFKRSYGYGRQFRLRGAVLWARHDKCKQSIVSTVRNGATPRASEA